MKMVSRMTAIVVAGVLALAVVAVPIAQAGERGPASERTQQMTQKAAKFYIARHLKKNYEKYWRDGHEKKIVDCKNLSRIRVRCKVSWYYKDKGFIHGSAIAFYKKNDPVHVYTRDDLEVSPV
jgi:hypothetical protein